MKPRALPTLEPRRAAVLPWDRREALSCLPPARRVRQAPEVPVSVKDMPQVFTFALVEVVSEDVKLSKGKARKAIVRGQVTVNGTVVYDPDMRVDGMARIVFKP